MRESIYGVLTVSLAAEGHIVGKRRCFEAVWAGIERGVQPLRRNIVCLCT